MNRVRNRNRAALFPARGLYKRAASECRFDSTHFQEEISSTSKLLQPAEVRLRVPELGICFVGLSTRRTSKSRCR